LKYHDFKHIKKAEILQENIPETGFKQGLIAIHYPAAVI